MFAYASDPCVRQWYDENRAISMWNAEPLCAATALAALAGAPALEIGAYVGGVTIALCRGIEAHDKRTSRSLSPREPVPRLISMEKGGSHTAHPRLPSSDILADWRRNLEEFGFSGAVHLIEGNFGADANVRECANRLNGAKLNLLCIDADGKVDWALNHIARHLAPGAVVIVDDYASSMFDDKSSITRPVVDRLCELGYLERWGLLSGQTWVGCTGADIAKLGFNSVFVTRARDQTEISIGPARRSRARNVFLRWITTRRGASGVMTPG